MSALADRLRQIHTRVESPSVSSYGPDVCGECDQAWPCAVIRVVDEVEPPERPHDEEAALAAELAGEAEAMAAFAEETFPAALEALLLTEGTPPLAPVTRPASPGATAARRTLRRR